MRVLALDLATVSGYAFGVFGKKPMSGTIKLSSDHWRGQRMLLLEGRVRDLITGLKVEHVVIEDVYAAPSHRFNMNNAKLLHSYRSAVEMACAKCGLIEKDITFVVPGQWRKTFGTNEVPPQVRRSPKQSAVRDWLKQAAFKRCQELGWEPANLDEADSLGIWSYCESLFEPFIAGERLPLFAMGNL
jgi:hypothetical protein